MKTMPELTTILCKIYMPMSEQKIYHNKRCCRVQLCHTAQILMQLLHRYQFECIHLAVATAGNEVLRDCQVIDSIVVYKQSLTFYINCIRSARNQLRLLSHLLRDGCLF